MRMIFTVCRLSPFAIGLVLLPASALADELQQQIVAGARAVTDTDFAFTETITAQRTGKPAEEFVTRYDPKRPAAARWTLVRAKGVAPTSKQNADFAKRAPKRPVPSYADIAKWFGGPAKRVASSPDSVTYRFASLAKGAIKLGPSDVSADTAAEAVVNTSGRVPYVERVRFTSTKGFRMMMVAKVDRMEVTTSYRPIGGRPMIVASAVDMSGSMMGKAGGFKTRTNYTDIRPMR